MAWWTMNLMKRDYHHLSATVYLARVSLHYVFIVHIKLPNSSSYPIHSSTCSSQSCTPSRRSSFDAPRSPPVQLALAAPRSISNLCRTCQPLRYIHQEVTRYMHIVFVPVVKDMTTSLGIHLLKRIMETEKGGERMQRAMRDGESDDWYTSTSIPLSSPRMAVVMMSWKEHPPLALASFPITNLMLR